MAMTTRACRVALLVLTVFFSASASFLAQTPPAPAAQTAALPHVHLFATGGTISNRNGGRLTVDELIQSIPGLDRRVRATGEQFSNVASGAVTMEMWLDLARRINDRFRKDAGLAGVVVTSGTDTLEELAYFLHLTVRDERPCVVVGSMRNPSTLGYEGSANLEDAFLVAADPASRGMGGLVVLNDEINSAREVTKTDSRLLSTFSARQDGVLGTVFDRVQYVRKPVRRHTAASEFNVDTIKALPRVDVILDLPGRAGRPHQGGRGQRREGHRDRRGRRRRDERHAGRGHHVCRRQGCVRRHDHAHRWRRRRRGGAAPPGGLAATICSRSRPACS